MGKVIILLLVTVFSAGISTTTDAMIKQFSRTLSSIANHCYTKPTTPVSTLTTTCLFGSLAYKKSSYVFKEFDYYRDRSFFVLITNTYTHELFGYDLDQEKLDQAIYCYQRNLATETFNNHNLKVLFKDDDPIGIIGYNKDPYDEEVGYIHSIAIHPEYRGKGYGQKIFNYAQQQLISQGQSELVLLDVFKLNKQAKEWYERMGYMKKSETEKTITLSYIVPTTELGTLATPDFR